MKNSLQMKSKYTSIICFFSLIYAMAVAQPNNQKTIETNGLRGNLGVHDPVMIKGGDTIPIMFLVLGYQVKAMALY